MALAGGEMSAPNIHPGDAEGSPLYRYVAQLDPDVQMPPRGAGLSAEEVARVRQWIAEGARWPESASVQLANPLDWWSLRPIARPSVPAGDVHPIDAFVRARLAQDGLVMAGAADARTLLRRVAFDLTGLPPTPEECDAFLADADPLKYEKLVDRLLASPRHGERWARHWLDVVHYADTHGYDKDKPREHAWPYRDYVIRAFNEDKPYARFVEEQLAGDALYPGTRDGIEALGFIAAGPWDLIGHEEVSEDKIDGKFSRHFDRDDMVGNAIGTFASATVQCAQCHHHKFDPVSQEDYYALQAVFAALDRADRSYDTDPLVAARRETLGSERARLTQRLHELDDSLAKAGGEEYAELERAIARAMQTGPAPEFGYHSELAGDPGLHKWVEVDLGTPQAFESVVLFPAHDDFNGIGAGFGFPQEFRVDACDEADFTAGVQELARGTHAALGSPLTSPVVLATPGAKARFVRVTATKLAPRKEDYIFALAELELRDGHARNIAQGAAVLSLDSIELGERWRRTNLTDGIAPARSSPKAASAEDAQRLLARRETLRLQLEDEATRRRRSELQERLAVIEVEIKALPPQALVYAGTVHHGSGAFMGTGASGGKPRAIRVLARGQVTSPGALVAPAALRMLEPQLPAQFELPDDAPESVRRAALARWLVDERNPLVWRSIVNRVWHYHFGRGLVATPNDFGRMGASPSHPELLDWLAATFRDDMRGSLKSLHRLIVTSAVYRQQSAVTNPQAEAIDSENTLLWRMNARKLEAEAVRDAVLLASGSLNLTMGGPGYRDFVIERPEHSPHYRYDLADPDDPATFRRSIYRFIVRSQLQPFLTALDCADPSMRVDRRNTSLSPNQALAYLNNGFMLAQAQRMAARVLREAGTDPGAQIEHAVRLSLGRSPRVEERDRLAAFVREHGLANACRVLFNLNEFSFVD